MGCKGHVIDANLATADGQKIIGSTVGGQRSAKGRHKRVASKKIVAKEREFQEPNRGQQIDTWECITLPRLATG